MNHSKRYVLSFGVLIAFLFLIPATSVAQSLEDPAPNFWDHVRFGGGLGLNFGNGFFSGSISPSAIYQFNPYFSAGPSLIYSYQKSDFFKSSLYGGSIIGLANPIPEIQLSAEIEQLRVNQEVEFIDGIEEDDFWNTALFVGAGFRTGGVTIGIRYNVLFQEGESIYADAWAPFVRVYF